MLSIPTENTNNVPPGFDQKIAAETCAVPYCATGNGLVGEGGCVGWHQINGLRHHFKDSTETADSELAEKVITGCPFAPEVKALLRGWSKAPDNESKVE